ncbi:MAG: ABC transporter permease subunit, partial [Thermodesulfobacteriota bacterium]|nr:ABC transporter permease subunit [Thermodesulfobacteriota bacterium]
MIHKIFKNPITRKRLIRFKEVKRAYISLWILVILYLVSLGSELICNNNPLYVRFNSKSYYPILKFYPEDLFAGNGEKTRPDYKKINNSDFFRRDPDNFMIFPLVPYSPYESINPESIPVSDNITLTFTPMPGIGTVNIGKDFSIIRSASFGFFIGRRDEEVKSLVLTEYINIPERVRQAVAKRFANENAPHLTISGVKSYDGVEAAISLSAFRRRSKPPETVRMTFREAGTIDQNPEKYVLSKELEFIENSTGHDDREIWNYLSGRDRETILNLAERRFLGPIDTVVLRIKNRFYRVSFEKQDVRFPFAPVKGHLMGIDGAGRDVLSRILYGLRTSLTFGLLLVACSMAMGIIAGALQGYYGGAIDITGQRFIEIWSALPFLYIMILMGSVYGRSFSLLLFCYGLFNWIGISYYVRAEFLRLRKKAFVEAAKCMGISSFRIIFKHILPNAMVPVLTFFPFSLV